MDVTLSSHSPFCLVQEHTARVMELPVFMTGLSSVISSGQTILTGVLEA